MFAVNISGVLADGQIIDQTTYSWEWDENWEAQDGAHAGRLVGRDPDPAARAALRRQRCRSRAGASRRRASSPQRQETDLWAYFPRDVATPIAYLGRLDDLRGLKGGGRAGAAPVRRRLRAPAGRHRDTRGQRLQLGGSAGLDLKWHLAHDLTLDAAFNPDFAQVEADQVILNLTNFETFLPEKRPFFLEGIDAFSFPLQVFYSRRIGARAAARRRCGTTPRASSWSTSRRPPRSTAPASWSAASGRPGRSAR